MGDVLLRDVMMVDAVTGASVADVRIRGEHIESIGTAEAQPDDEVHDLAGYLLLPAATEPHAHLDKAFLAELFENATGDLLGAIEAMIAGRPSLAVAETVERAERAARLMAANGFVAIRSHVDTTVDSGLIGTEALVEVRRRLAGLVDIEIVALCGWPITGAAGADQRALLVDALAAGADIVGGCPHLDERGTLEPTEILLGIAADHGVGIDLHTDETLDPAVDGLSELARLVTVTGFPHPVTASHCVSLGVQTPNRQTEVAEAVAAAGISVVTLPATNLFLQGRAHQQAMPRGLTAVKALRAAGVVVAAGADNLQDPFNPLGKGDPFDTAGLMILTTHSSPADAWAAVSDQAARAIGRPPPTIAPGAVADLIAVRAGTLREAIAVGPGDRLVWRRGRRFRREDLVAAT